MRAALVTVLVLVVPAVGSLGVPAPDWRAKADAPLLQAFDAGEPSLAVFVQGPALAQLPPVTERAAWKAQWPAGAEPFLAALRTQALVLGGTVTLEVPAIDGAFVHLPRAALPALLALPSVRLAGLDRMGAVHPIDVAGGPSVTASTEEAVAHLQAPDVWALGYQGEGIKVAIVDTGIRPTHDVFRNADGSTRVTAWYDATGPTGRCDTPCDDNGHGTAVAHAAVGGRAFNGSASRGAAPAADIVGVRIFQGGGGSWEDAQEGLQAAFDLGAEVATASWGGSCDSAASVATAELAEALGDAGMPVAASAGASGPAPGSIVCPARADRVITGGGLDLAENVFGPSGRGPCTWHDITRVCPDLMAVVVNLDLASSDCDTCYHQLSGTSFSNAQLAGGVALLHQVSKVVQGRGLNHSMEAELLLRYTARDLGAPGSDNDYGWGIAQLRAAHDVLVGDQVFYLRDALSIQRPVMQGYEGNQLGFILTSLGSAPLSGHVVFEADQQDTGACPPTCEHVSIADQDQGLTRFSQAVFATNFSGADHHAGTYIVHARYDYSYIDPNDGSLHTGAIDRTGSFVLRKVDLQRARTIPASSTTGTPLLAELKLANIGNENASDLQVTEHFNMQGFLPLPAVPPGLPPYGLFANPAPRAVSLDPNGPSHYDWAPQAVAAGGAWDAHYDFLAALAGDYTFAADITYADETGHVFVERFEQPASVTPP